MVPRNVARISEYVAKRLWSVPGRSQSAPKWASTVLTCGTGAPAGKVSSSPARTLRVWSPTVMRASWSMATVVVTGNVSPAAGVTAGRPSDCHCSTRKITGTASAVSFSQYWNAWTKVIARIPPSATFAVTVRPTSRAPQTYDPPVTVVNVSPAPCSCGTRYRQPMKTTNTVAIRRSPVERRRSSAKSGRVNAPDRRSGAATNSSSARYPAATPTGYQSTSTPYRRTRPATPRKDAADRYSPLIAAAFQDGLTEREATRKSEVVRANRKPYAPMPTVTRTTAIRPGTRYGFTAPASGSAR